MPVGYHRNVSAASPARRVSDPAAAISAHFAGSAAENCRWFGIRSASSQASLLNPLGLVIRRGAAERYLWIGKLNH
jgi:hypothetical protein